MGTFKGFTERGYEFTAEIVAPYNTAMLERPQLGQFILIELGSIDEASLGRVTKFVPSGLLATAEGEDYINTLQSRDQQVPEDLKEQKLKYRIQIKLLGAVKLIENRENKKDIIFIPSQRRLPHLGAKVALPSSGVLKKLCSLNRGETDLGDYVLGEFVYNGRQNESGIPGKFRSLSPQLKVTFNINNLVSKRSTVFARAGYGKSNLIKFLISELYRKGIPRTEKGQEVGTLIFDAEGEYFWPDFKGRPGLCDVPHLEQNIIVFTNRESENTYYERWKAGAVKLDIRDLPARDVIGIAISPDRQTQQNIIKLKSLNRTNWRQMVDLITREGLQADDNEIGRLLGYSNSEAKAEIAAARSNMNNVVNHLHDPNSKLITGTISALKQGLVVVIDISMLSSTAGYNIAGLLLRKIFSYNQENFTGGKSPVPVISVIEEAQSVLGKHLEESSPFVEWVKEGRKYDLGAILVTQQPGSLAPELLSQADNWFCFHLLSEGDASTLGRYNSHYSHDILAHLIGEPIPGNCYMWSSPEQPFVLPVRIRNFESLYKANLGDTAGASGGKPSPAFEIRRKSEVRDYALAEALKETINLNQDRLSIEKFNDGAYIGLYEGQLYVFLTQVLKKKEFNDELRDANELKIPILRILLNHQIVEMQGKKGNYLCAPPGNWKAIFKKTS